MSHTLSSYFSADHLILYVFLIITLVIGLGASRGIKDIKDYALAGRTFGVGALTITFLATYLSGGNTIEFQTTIIKHGLVPMIHRVGILLAFVFAGIYLAPRLIKKFGDSLTMGDIMKNLYGNYAGILTGTLGT
jgi:SSS family solute:Na+ symporter